MDLSSEATTVLVAILAGLLSVVPVAIGLLKTYLEVRTNRLRIEDRPTHDQVAAAIDSKLQQLQEGTNAQNESSSPTGGGGSGSNTGA